VGEPLRTLETPDGRTLAYAVWGDPDGYPVFGLHGTPGCRLERWPHEELYTGAAVCFVTHDRAGYAKSDRRRGRRIADEVDDVRALADELGFERFGVTGASGGGPHALACAALLSDRVERTVCVVGVAPFGTPGLEYDAWVGGQDPENVKEFGWALAGEEVLTPALTKLREEVVARVAVDPSTVLGDFDLSEADRAQLATAERIQIIRESVAEQAAGDIWGWVDDDLAITRPWGFDVSAITIPVLIRYGLTDVLVPAAHGEWLAANVPGCLVKVDGVGGHLGVAPADEIAENLRWLATGVAPDGLT
jgi:pimeloyl-ACP methyl ester carboxylesterase